MNNELHPGNNEFEYFGSITPRPISKTIKGSIQESLQDFSIFHQPYDTNQDSKKECQYKFENDDNHAKFLKIQEK